MIEVPMTEAQFATATERLASHGVQLAGPTGTLSRNGVTARYEHADGVLRITIVDKPFLLPESLIEGQLKGYLEKAVGTL